MDGTTEKSPEVAKVELVMAFTTQFDKNLEARGFTPEQRRAVIGVMMDTRVDIAAEVPQVPAPA